jgi:hypothetical protein
VLLHMKLAKATYKTDPGRALRCGYKKADSHKFSHGTRHTERTPTTNSQSPSDQWVVKLVWWRYWSRSTRPN